MEIQEKIEWVYSQEKLFAVGAFKKKIIYGLKVVHLEVFSSARQKKKKKKVD